MGGTGAAIRDNSAIYFSNPASYSSLDTNSFLFDFGIDYGRNVISDGASRFKTTDLSFDHLLMGFPISRGFCVATGLYNMSNSYYKLAQEVEEGDPEYDPIAGAYTSFHNGTGGMTNFFIGTGFNITKYFSAGINMKVLFGTIKRSNELDFLDFYNVYHDNFTERLRLSGVNFEYGLQFMYPLKKNNFFNAGISMSSGKHYKSEYESIQYRYTAYGGTDTLEYILDETSKAFLPGTLRLGIAFGKNNKYVVAVDYIMTNWTNANFYGSDGYLGDIRNLLFGVEFIPDKFSNYNYLKRIEYRIGGHIGNNYLSLDGVQVREFGLSYGMSIPMKFLSKTNLFFDFTRKSYEGTPLYPQHYENYITMGASLNLYDLWFVKRKYD